MDLQIVIDTNVWISGLVFGGKPEKIIHLFIDGKITVIMSEELISELRRKITQQFVLFRPQVDLLEASIREDALIVQLGSVEVTASRDADDNRVIETAMVGGANYIVTGDKDLLSLTRHKGVEIVNPSEFLKLIA